MGRLKEAREKFIEEVATIQKDPKPEPAVWCGPAGSCADQPSTRQLRRGQAMYKLAQRIGEAALPVSNMEDIHTLNDLAFLYMDQGRYADANVLLEQAIANVKKGYGPCPLRRPSEALEQPRRDGRQHGRTAPRPREGCCSGALDIGTRTQIGVDKRAVVHTWTTWGATPPAKAGVCRRGRPLYLPSPQPGRKPRARTILTFSARPGGGLH